jgi:hypothetical protein
MARTQEHDTHAKIGWEGKNSPPPFVLFYLYDARTSMAQRPSRLASSTSVHDFMPGHARDAEEPDVIVGHSCMRVMRVSAPWCADNFPDAPPLPYFVKIKLTNLNKKTLTPS